MKGSVPLDVDVHHLHPFVDLEVEDLAEQHDACAIHEDIDTTVNLDSVLNNGLPIGRLGDIELERRDLSREGFYIRFLGQIK